MVAVCSWPLICSSTIDYVTQNRKLTSSSRIVAGTALFVAFVAIIAFALKPDNVAVPEPFEGSSKSVSQGNEAPPAENVPRSVDASYSEDSVSGATIMSSAAATKSFVPHQMYLKYVDQAGAGELVAVGILIEDLRYCRNMGKESYGEYASYEDVIRQSALNLETQKSLIEKSEQCAPLVELVGDTDQEATRLYEIISESRHPLIMVRQRNVTADEKRDRILAVILADYPEFFLYDRAFMEAGVYHRIYPEHVDVYREQAWFLLNCDASLSCDRSELRHQLSSKYFHGHEIREIEEIEASIREAIREKDVQRLGL